MPEAINLPRAAAQHILAYLETRPYREVERGVAWLRAALATSSQGAVKEPARDNEAGEPAGQTQS